MNTPNKNQLRRLSAIVHVMNSCQLMSITQIQEKVNDIMDENFSRSTIEKDLFNLKMNYDLEYETFMNRGIKIDSKVDFLGILKNHLNLF